MIPPVWLVVRVGWVCLPLPVILLWPLAAIVWIVAGLVMTIALLASGGEPVAVGRLWLESWRLLCHLRGIRVDVEQPHIRVKILIV